MRSRFEETAQSTEQHRFASMAKTHVGLLRKINEDRLLDRPDARIWAVADGMGGHQCGGAAATAAIRALDVCADAPSRLNDTSIRQALQRANDAIRAEQPDGAVSGCTIAGMFATQSHAHLFWAGDSRVYRYRGNTLTRLTSDHSVVQELIDAGALPEEQAKDHPQAHVITRALGIEDHPKIAFAETVLASGDRYLICSDGLWGMMPTATLREALSLPRDKSAERLCAMALDGGGRDNLSLVLVDFG